jgi:hypothetical protein
VFRFFKKKFKEESKPKVDISHLPALNAWGILFQGNGLTLYSRFAGHIPGETADYIYLKSYPEIYELERKTFGDWLYIVKTGVFLQRWDAVDAPECTLVFIDFSTLEVTELKTDIPARRWSVLEQNGKVSFTFSGDGYEEVFEAEV